jgi:hypothetical protein
MKVLMEILSSDSFKNASVIFIGIMAYLKLIEILGISESPTERPLTIEEQEALIKVIREHAEIKNNKVA